MYKRTAVTIWLLFICCAWQSASALVCFRDNFEEAYTQVGSTAQGGTNPLIAICTTPVYECMNSLSLTRTGAGITPVISSKLYCYPDPNLITVQEGCDLVYKMSVKRTQYGAGQCYINLGTGTAAIHAGWSIRTDLGKTVYSFRDCNDWVDSNCVANPTGWDTIELRLHLIKISQSSSYIHGTYDAYVSKENGERNLVASGLRIADLTTNGTTTVTLCMSWVASGTAYTYWDDLSIEKVPATGSSVVFSDNLETHPVGLLTAAYPWTAPVQIGTQWYVYGSPNGIDVNTAVVKTGLKSLGLTRIGSQSPLLFAVASLNNVTAGYDLNYSVDVYRPAANHGHQGYIRIGAGIMGGWCVNGYGRYAVQHRGNWIDSGITPAVGGWENIKMIAHLVDADTKIGGTYDVYVTAPGRPAKIIAYGYTLTPTTTDNYARLYIANNPPAGGSTACKTYWDNFVIERIKTQPVNYAIISWGDNSYVYGPATDSAMDTPVGIKSLFQRLRDRGYTGLFIRTDLFQHDQNEIIYNENLVPTVALLLRRSIDDVADRFDVTGTMRTAALDQTLDFIMYHPSVYSNGAPASTQWPYEYKFVSGPNEQFLTVDLRGKKQYMVPEYAYAQVRAAKVNEIHDVVNICNLTGIIPSMRTEAGQIYIADQNNIPIKADQFGFNQPVVTDMAAKGINILTDPNFDVFSPDFNRVSAKVETWRTLRGSYLTKFFDELRADFNSFTQPVRIGIQIPGNRVGPELGNWIIDWRKMVDQGSINFIVQPVSLQGWPDPCLATRGYITDTNTTAQYREYIRKSPHPEVKLIKTGQWEYFRTPVDTNTVGWQTFWAYEGFDLAWFQRWQQWKRDIADANIGGVNFIVQNFDSFPSYSTENCGAQGDSRYDPNVRLCPGAWYQFGDGTDAYKYPVVESNIYYSFPNAAKITGGAYTKALYAVHNSGSDRTSFQARVDNIIENGTSTLEFMLYLEPNSTLDAYVYSGERKIGITVGKATGNIVKYKDQNGNWASSACTLSARSWHRIVLDINVDSNSYSVTADSSQVCQNVTYRAANKMLNKLMFLPTFSNKNDNSSYIDNVIWKWYPDLKFVPQRSNTLLLEDFECHTVTEKIGPFSAPRIGKRWKTDPADSSALIIDSNTSFGNGFKCLASSSGPHTLYSNDTGKITLSGIVTLDFDVYPRGSVSSPDSNSVFSLRQTLAGPPSLAVQLDSKWKYWNGSAFVASNVNVAYETWNHVQISLDSTTNQCKIVVQPCGLMPILVYQGNNASAGQQVFFAFQPKCKTGKTVCIDNIVITR